MKVQNRFHYAMVSRMRIAYLKYDSHLWKTNRKEVNINPKVGFSTSYYRGLPTQCPMCPMPSLRLEQLSATKTSGNGPVPGKISYY